MLNNLSWLLLAMGWVEPEEEHDDAEGYESYRCSQQDTLRTLTWHE